MAVGATGSRSRQQLADRVYLIGPTPPPLGGVSVYIHRLSRILREKGNDVINVNLAAARGLRKIGLILKLLFDPRPAEFQVHAFDFSAMAALLLRPFSKRVVYMDHGTGLYNTQLSGLRKFIFRSTLLRADEILFVSEEGMHFYRTAGYSMTANTRVQHAFLPPPLSARDSVLATYPAGTLDFIRNKSPLLVANASQLVFYNGVDLYGLDLCIELTERLRRTYPGIGFLFAIGDADYNRPYLEESRRTLRSKLLSESFEFLVGQREVWPAFAEGDIMLRPTSNDGYAISLEEAIFLGTPTLASDAAKRPAGTVLFQNRDIDDLERKAMEMLQSLAPQKIQ